MLENRKILTILIGYIIGIILGLYCKYSIVLFYLLFYLLYINFFKEHKTKKFKLISFKRYLRYVKIVFNKKVMKTIIIFSIISNFIVLYQNYRYENLYNGYDNKNIKIAGIIVFTEGDKYTVKVETKKFKTELSNILSEHSIRIARENAVKQLEENPNLHDKYIEDAIGEIDRITLWKQVI